MIKDEKSGNHSFRFLLSICASLLNLQCTPWCTCTISWETLPFIHYPPQFNGQRSGEQTGQEIISVLTIILTEN